MLGSHLFINNLICKSMKKIFSNYRYYVLFVLGLITTIGFFAVPDDELPALSWVYVLVSSKVITLEAAG